MTSAASACPRMAFPDTGRKVGILARLNAHVFGSPDLGKAYGGYRKALKKHKAAPALRAERQGETPVYHMDRSSSRHALPTIWLSEKVGMPDGSQGYARAFTTYYPSSADRGGIRALELAERYFAEGLNIKGENEEYMRIQCFQAAELLYLHAMKRGNISACTRLGVLYRFDMCRGSYIKDVLFKHGKHAKSLSLHQTAFALFRKAAARGEAESMVHLGEMLCEGIGCKMNRSLAYAFFKKALKRCTGMRFDEVEGCVLDDGKRREMHRALCSDIKNASVMGSAALHIAESFEQGWSAVQSFGMAKIWYEVAYEALSVSFGSGFWYSKRNKSKARWGYMRALQEMNGKY